jgi:polysaccharide biosynthesis transport protein
MNNNLNSDNFLETEGNSFKDYLFLIRNNLVPVVLITFTCLIVSIIYAVNARNIYDSTATIKVSKPQGSILNSPMIPEFSDFGNDRFIANEIEVLKTYNTRERVAKALIDSFKANNNAKDYYLIINHENRTNPQASKLLPADVIAKILEGNVSVEQKRGLDIIDIKADSPSPVEAAMIANCYTQQYQELNLEQNRNQLTYVKNFLRQQRDEKQEELTKAEDNLRAFQEKGGIIALDDQATSLINQISQFEAQRDATEIDLKASSKVLNEYKAELERQNPRLAEYLQSSSSEAYFQSLQEQLVKLEVNRDVALANSKNKSENENLVSDYDEKIRDLKDKLNQKITEIKAGIFASSPDEVRDLSQKIIEEQVKNQSLKISLSTLDSIVDKYDAKFNKLPKTAIELARYQRKRESLENLYNLIEEKYQEALINEQSQPGNVLIIDNARKPNSPSKPNRILIVLVGLVLGAGMSFGYVFIKNYFDNTVKTPEDMEKKNINVLAWIPQIEGLGINGSNEFDFIVAKKPDSIPSEAFRALRTRVQFTKVDSESLKTILITSSAPQEGKTTIAVNLAGSFAQSNKKTLMLDCDLRKPRVHSVFNSNRIPGVIDYLFNQASLDEIIRPTEIENLSFIATGTIPPNPAEMLESKPMHEFIDRMRERFDIVIMDSPPIIAVTDSEILATMVDGVILIVSADTTEVDLMEKSVGLMKNDKVSFLGSVLNNFSYKSGYGSYYKYYYYYSHPKNDGDKTTRNRRTKTES